MPSQSGKQRLAMKFYTSGRVAEFSNISVYEEDFEIAPPSDEWRHSDPENRSEF